jgi:hypothetical protein
LCWPEVLRPSGKRDLGAVGAVVVVVVVVVIFALGFGLGFDGMEFGLSLSGRNGLKWIVRDLVVCSALSFESGDCSPGREVT